MSLVHRLDLLESAGLVQWAQTQPDLEYAFRHSLVQEAAYRSLVKPDRRQLHQAVAEALERIYADRAQELAPLLAHHFVESGEDERALKYYALAGDAAARAYANVEAAAHYTRAIEIA